MPQKYKVNRFSHPRRECTQLKNVYQRFFYFQKFCCYFQFFFLKNSIFLAGSQPQTQIAMRLQASDPTSRQPSGKNWHGSVAVWSARWCTTDQSQTSRKTNQRFNEKVRWGLTGNNERAHNGAPEAALATCGHTAKKTSSWSDWRLPWRNGVRRSEGSRAQVATSSLNHQAITVAVAGQAPHQRCHCWSNSLYGRSCGVSLQEQQALAEEKSQSPSPIPQSNFFEITSPFFCVYSTQIGQHLQELHRAIVCKAASPRKWPPVHCSQTSLSTKKRITPIKGLV